MLESTAGPPRKPVLAATKRSPASSASTTSKTVYDRSKGDCVERLSFHRARAPQQVQQNDPAGGEGERQRHVEHGDLAGMNSRLCEHVDVVRHSFDAGVGATPL